MPSAFEIFKQGPKFKSIPDPRVDVQVMMSNYEKISDQEGSIGTAGCATCVGLIVIQKNPRVIHCAHFSCAISPIGVEKIRAIYVATISILQKSFPLPGDVHEIGFTSTSKDKSTLTIISAINNYYCEGKDDIMPGELLAIWSDGSSIEKVHNLSGGRLVQTNERAAIK